MRQTAPAHPQQPPRLRSGYDLHARGPADRRHIQLGAECGLCEGHRQLVDEVRAIAQETLILLDLEHDEHVAARSATHTRIADTAQRDVIARRHARWHADFDLLAAALHAAAVALIARLFDALAFTATVRTRHDTDQLSEERTLHAPHFTGASTRCTTHGSGAFRCTAPAALRARIQQLEFDLPLQARRNFVERERQIHAHVSALAHCRTAAATLRTEQIVNTEAAEIAHEDLERIGKAETTICAARCAALHTGKTITIVCRALVGIPQHFVRLGQLLELLFRFGRTLVLVRMMLQRKLAIRTLDVVRIRRALDAEDLVIITHSFRPARSPAPSSGCSCSRRSRRLSHTACALDQSRPARP